jgi:cardiolipin synthase (CMP-forming)
MLWLRSAIETRLIQSRISYVTKLHSSVRCVSHATFPSRQFESLWTSSPPLEAATQGKIALRGYKTTETKTSRPSYRPWSGVAGGQAVNWILQQRQFHTNQKLQSDSGKNDKKSEITSKIGHVAKENIYTLPNLITFSRLVAAPAIGYLLIDGQPFWALTLVVYSGITDLLDGYIARRYKMQTVVGSVIDPMADKALMIILASCLCISGDIPVYMAVLILGRDILLGFSALYYRYISLEPPKSFRRFWDFSIPSAEVRPTTISKYNTFLQMVYLGLSLLFPVIKGSFSPEAYTHIINGMTVLEYTVASTTILSGLSYVFSKDAVRILRKK